MPPQPQTPDWEWHNLTDQPRLDNLELLDRLRTLSPILWGLITSTKPPTALALANRLALPREPTLYELRRYKSDYLVYDEALASTGMVWKLLDEEYLDLQNWVKDLRRTNRLETKQPPDDVDWSQARVIAAHKPESED